VIAADASPEAGYFFRSDHFPMAKRGVPMLYVDSGIDLINGGRAAGTAAAEKYRRDAYHQPADEYDPSWNFGGIVQDVTVLIPPRDGAREQPRLAELPHQQRVPRAPRQERRRPPVAPYAAGCGRRELQRPPPGERCGFGRIVRSPVRKEAVPAS
jgi:hypothetical protein